MWVLKSVSTKIERRFVTSNQKVTSRCQRFHNQQKLNYFFRYYQTQGKCQNPKAPGIGLANREMTRDGSIFCPHERLPSGRKVSLAIQEICEQFPPLQNFLPIPNVLALYWAQLVIHDVSQVFHIGRFKGGPGIASCTANNQQLPRQLESPYVKPMLVDDNDPFYSKFGVGCLNFAKKRTLNENCNVRKTNFVS